MPFARIISMLELKASQNGIRVVEQEESYTSRASYLDGDTIPVFGEDDAKDVVFSGKRRSRGVYVTGSSAVINSDLNGSVNIGRKAFPKMHSSIDSDAFSNVKLIRYPDYEAMLSNKNRQLAANGSISKAKQRRLARKAM